MATRPRSSENQFKVGQEVRVRLGGREVPAKIVEDRGKIGIRGRRLLRVRINLNGIDAGLGSGEDDGGREFELPAEEVKPAA